MGIIEAVYGDWLNETSDTDTGSETTSTLDNSNNTDALSDIKSGW